MVVRKARPVGRNNNIIVQAHRVSVQLMTPYPSRYVKVRYLAWKVHGVGLELGGARRWHATPSSNDRNRLGIGGSVPWSPAQGHRTRWQRAPSTVARRTPTPGIEPTCRDAGNPAWASGKCDLTAEPPAYHRPGHSEGGTGTKNGHKDGVYRGVLGSTRQVWLGAASVSAFCDPFTA
jgi:hypothetical protein